MSVHSITSAASYKMPAPEVVAPASQTQSDSGDANKGAGKSHIDNESKELLRYVSEDFIFWAREGAPVAYHLETGNKIGKESFKHYCAKHYGVLVMVDHSKLDEQGNPVQRRMPLGPIWWEWEDPARRVVLEIVMEPTEKSAADDPRNNNSYNLWHQLKKTMAVRNPDATLHDIQPFLDHLMYISDGDTVAVMFFMNWLANLYQFPGTKMPTALLMYSKHGRVGKSMVYKILKAVFGPPLCATADGSIINSKFMDAMENKRIVFLNEMSRSDKLDGYERFKSLVSEEEGTFEGKGRAAHKVQNFTHYIITTNHEDALPLMEKDGRIAIFRCLSERRDNAYYKMMHEWIEGPGPAALAQVLATWTFPVEWDAHASVPQTDATRALQQASRPAAVNLVEALIENRQPPFDKDMGQIHTILVQMETTCGHKNMAGISDRSLGKAFATLKLTKIGGKGDYGAWCWANQIYWSRQDTKTWRDYLFSGTVPKDYPTAVVTADKTNVTPINGGKSQ